MSGVSFFVKTFGQNSVRRRRSDKHRRQEGSSGGTQTPDVVPVWDTPPPPVLPPPAYLPHGYRRSLRSKRGKGHERVVEIFLLKNLVVFWYACICEIV